MLYNLYPLLSVVVFMNEVSQVQEPRCFSSGKSLVKTVLNSDQCLDQSNSRIEHQLTVSSLNYDFRGTADFNCMSFAAIYIYMSYSTEHRISVNMNGSLPSDIL